MYINSNIFNSVFFSFLFLITYKINNSEPRRATSSRRCAINISSGEEVINIVELLFIYLFGSLVAYSSPRDNNNYTMTIILIRVYNIITTKYSQRENARVIFEREVYGMCVL